MRKPKSMRDLSQFSHSNDKIEIIYNDHSSYVKKTFYTDIERAKRNVEKQRLFRSMYTGHARISAAEVLDFKIHESSAELLMPYVEGITGRTFLIHATRNIAQVLSKTLSTLIYTELNNSCEEVVDLSLFKVKIQSVVESTSDRDLRSLVGRAMDKLKMLPLQMKFPIGPCHGDLTISNIILDQVSGVTLIDFLDTYLETPLQDVAKLKQDFIYGWSFRKEPDSLGVKAKIFCRYHLPQAMLQVEKMYPRQVWLMTLMTLVRIAPYVKDHNTKQWLEKSIKHCLECE